MKRNKVLDEGSFVKENVPADVEFEDYMRNEKEKPPVKDFTLSEYTEKGKNCLTFVVLLFYHCFIFNTLKYF